MTSTRILIFGDSQVANAFRSYGFASILNDRFDGKADIFVRKFPGYTSEWIRLLTSSCSRNLQGNNPDYVILMLGRDDCLRSSKDTRDPVNLNEFSKNLSSILNKITNEVDVIAEKFIILAPVPMHQMKFDTYDQNAFNGVKLDSSTLKKVGDKAREVAKRAGGQYIDTSALLDNGLDVNVRKDGYRLSEEGHLIVAEKLMEYIQVAESPYPPVDMVGMDYKKQLDEIAKSSCIIPPLNIQAHTYTNTVDQYSAFFKKTYRGKV